jgi:hypothetical protein
MGGEMKIRSRQSGGLTGLARGYEVNSTSLPSAEASELTALVEQAGLGHSLEAHSPRGRDLTRYDLAIETPAAVRTVSVDDLTAPEQLWPLLEFLTRRARPLPPAKTARTGAAQQD